jgi:hypothetical protein
MNKKTKSDAKPNPGWFRKGQSGNPRGRPAASPAPRGSVFDVVLEKTLSVRHRGGTREMTMEEALQQRTLQNALDGKRVAEREVLKWTLKREEWLLKNGPEAPWPPVKRYFSPDPDNADAALQLLGIAAPNPARANIGLERAQLLLEPWAVQAALSRRRGGSRLTDGDRDWIRRCTRDPGSLRWPRGTNE